MTTGSGALHAAGRSLAVISPRAVILLAVALGIAAIAAAQLSTAAFGLVAAAILALAGVATLRWPRVMLVVLVMSPALVDLYAGQRLLPEPVQPISRLFSEVLLLVMTCTLAVVAAQRGTLAAAIRHPFSAAAGVFVAVSILSAAVNRVPPEVATSGLLFTLDAVVLFYLPRLVGYSSDQARTAMWAVAAVVAVTSLLAIGQAVLSPDLLGVTPVTGRSGEGVRLGSLVRDPNILGTLIGMALPFTMFSLVRLSQGRTRWLVRGAALALTIALLLTYSRGSWIGLMLGFGGVALIIDRRALVAFLAVLLVAYATVVAMPKGILGGLVQGFDPFATTINRFDAVGEGRDLRTLFILNALPIVSDHPLLGVGPGRYGGAAASVFGSPIHEEYGTDRLLTRQRTVDNFWLHIGVEGGVVGATAFLAMIATALVAPGRALRRHRGTRFSVPAGVVSATAVVCVATVTTMLLEGNTAAFLFWFLLGLGSMALFADPSSSPAATRASGAGDE